MGRALAVLAVASCSPPTPSITAPTFVAPVSTPEPTQSAEPTQTAATSTPQFTAAADAAFSVQPPDEIAGLAMRPGSPNLYIAVSRLGSSWLSTDGVTWVGGGQLAFKLGLLGRAVRDLAYSEGRFVAVGRESFYPDDVLTQGLMWTSEDGVDWRATRIGFVEIRGLAAGSEPLVAAAIDEGARSGYGGGFARLDGDRWTLQRPTESTLTAIGIGRPDDVVPVGDRFLLVGGRAYGGGWIARVVLFDGKREWHWLTSDAPTGNSLDQVTIAPGGFAALSTDGALWTAQAVDRWAGPAELPFVAAHIDTAPDGSLLAMGDGIWQSTDGETWLRVDDGTAPDGRWAYAEGVAIGCAEHLCRAFKTRLLGSE